MDTRKRMMAMALGTAFFAAAGFALADAVIFNGVTYTCTNTCVITVKPDGTWGVVDSLGGRVKITFPGRRD
jgi:hypothetical protein